MLILARTTQGRWSWIAFVLLFYTLFTSAQEIFAAEPTGQPVTDEPITVKATWGGGIPGIVSVWLQKADPSTQDFTNVTVADSHQTDGQTAQIPGSAESAEIKVPASAVDFEASYRFVIVYGADGSDNYYFSTPFQLLAASPSTSSGQIPATSSLSTALSSPVSSSEVTSSTTSDPRSSVSSIIADSSSNPSSDSDLSSGAVAGVAIACIIVVVILALVAFVLLRRHLSHNTRPVPSDEVQSKKAIQELEGSENALGTVFEKGDEEQPAISAIDVAPAELDGTNEIFELKGDSFRPRDN